VRPLALTRGDRARTVLLLRCAAEVAVTDAHVLGPSWTASCLHMSKASRKRACSLATRAAQYVARSTCRDIERAQGLDEYLAVVLEAAICVEEGSWP